LQLCDIAQPENNNNSVFKSSEVGLELKENLAASEKECIARLL